MGTYDHSDGDVVVVPAALLGAGEGRAWIEDVVAARGATDVGDVAVGIWEGKCGGVGRGVGAGGGGRGAVVGRGEGRRASAVMEVWR